MHMHVFANLGEATHVQIRVATNNVIKNVYGKAVIYLEKYFIL